METLGPVSKVEEDEGEGSGIEEAKEGAFVGVEKRGGAVDHP